MATYGWKATGIFLMLMWCFLTPLCADPVEIGEHSSDEMLLVAVQLDQHILCDDLEAYPISHDHFLLPLGKMCRFLGIGITVDPTQHTASGFILAQQRVFMLDIAQATVKIQGKTRPFDRQLVKIHQDDVYVADSLLSSWFPIAFTFDKHALLISIRARKPCPSSANGGESNWLRDWAPMPIPHSRPGLPSQNRTIACFLCPLSIKRWIFLQQWAAENTASTCFLPHC